MDASPAPNRRRQRTRNAIIEHARQMLVAQGVSGLSLRALAAQLDYTPGALYKYFASKEALIDAVRADCFARLNAFIAQRIPAAGRAADMLLEGGLAYIDYAGRHPQEYHLMFNMEPSWATSGAQREQAMRLLLQIVRQGVAQGEIAPRGAYDVATLTYHCWATVHGLASLQSSVLLEERADLAQANRLILQQVIDGFATTGPPAADPPPPRSNLMLPDWIDRQEYPFTPQEFSLSMGTMRYVDEGAGPPVVMVHGNPTWSFVYRHLIKGLRDQYRCIAMDHIGFGLSAKPADWSYQPQAHAANLRALLDALDLHDITLVVQDWGGPIGLSYALDNPQRVRRLVILNTWLWPVDDDWYYRAFSGLMGGPIGRFLIRRFNFFARSVVRQAYGDKSKLTPAIHRHYTNHLPTPESRQGSWVFPGAIIGATSWLAELWARRAALADKPVLLAWGLQDIAFREKELRRWQALFPDAAVVRYEGAGHYVQDEMGPDLAQRIGAFLRAG